ncbi:hypothetical protein [Actinomycetospora cinnamomea]|uniref:Uncharacterized protein n=1 Tax=Actinomycetospora cinnamomea TaxID=663609 RepID=A0A2U1F6P8_9PSEU|nr:hypothetical protein [Actinomycetospora cinnamomea]PVZ07861.1 hypothetical protein C8D89_11014 [Actinomycetospora cinnamomea]
MISPDKTDEQIEQEARDVAKEVVGLTDGLAELYCRYRWDGDDYPRFGAALARALGSTDFLEEPVHEHKLNELMVAAADAYRILYNRIEDARDEERYRRMS